MADDPWSEALKEAYVSAPTDTDPVSTFELWHPTFDEPVRVVHDEGELLSSDPEPVFGRQFKLEADAPRNAGETVDFIAAAFEAQMPASEDGQPPEMVIRLNNVDETLMEALDDAVEIGATLDAIYREYFIDDPDNVQFVLSGLTIKRVTATMLRLEGTAGFLDLYNSAFPNAVYTPQEHPSLAQ